VLALLALCGQVFEHSLGMKGVRAAELEGFGDEWDEEDEPAQAVVPPTSHIRPNFQASRSIEGSREDDEDDDDGGSDMVLKAAGVKPRHDEWDEVGLLVSVARNSIGFCKELSSQTASLVVKLPDALMVTRFRKACQVGSICSAVGAVGLLVHPGNCMCHWLVTWMVSANPLSTRTNNGVPLVPLVWQPKPLQGPRRFNDFHKTDKWTADILIHYH
jgi:hypothetical protein